MMIIDSHVQFWKYNKSRDSWITAKMKTLQQDYLPQQLAGTLQRNGVQGCIAIQTDPSPVETRFLSELSLTHPFIKGVVGWIDLQHDRVEEYLAEFAAQYPAIRGYRHSSIDEPAGFLKEKKIQRGIALLATYDYSFDLLINPRQLQDCIELVSKFPEQRFVLDHCGRPEVKRGKIEDWEMQIKELARYSNVFCKLSGLFTEARWKEWRAADFYPYFDVLFESFGTGRLMFGSDWPVLLLSGNYIQWKSLVEKYMENLSIEEREDVLGLNATRFYRVS